VLKVTDRAFGTEWRMPIANRWSDNITRIIVDKAHQSAADE
jgi:hypothetical protein